MCRVKTACKELEAVTKLKSLENCMGGLTPEWLKSLILDAPDVSTAASNLSDTVRKNPDHCLVLLQVLIQFAHLKCTSFSQRKKLGRFSLPQCLCVYKGERAWGQG